MTVNEADRDSGHGHSRRGLRKLWIVLLVVFGCLFGAWSWLFQESLTAVVTLSDGRTFKIHQTTLGKNHRLPENFERIDLGRDLGK